MDASRDTEAVSTAEEATGARPAVVLIVAPLEAAAAPAGATPEPAEATPEPAEATPEPAEATPEPAEAAPEPTVEAAPEPAAEALEAPLQGEAVPGAGLELAATARMSALRDDDQPTQKIRKPKPPRERTAEDDRLTAAVIPLDLRAEPSPLSDFLGQSLLYRAAHAAALAGAPRLILLGEVPAEQRRHLYEEAYEAFRGGPVELLEGDPVQHDFGRGRVLVLDSTALHDGEAVKRLAQVKGERTVLLLGPYGDGLKVRTDGGRITEVGQDVPDADGRLTGACSVPVEDFERLVGVGERAALEALGSAEQLLGTVAPRTYGQQFRNRDSFQAAQGYFFDELASRGQDGLFEDLVGRPLARGITRAVLHRPAITPSGISLVAGVLALVASFLLAFGSQAGALAGRVGALVAGFLLIGSAVLDRVDGELARLRLDEDEDARHLDFGLDHLAHMLVFLGLAWYVDVHQDLAAVIERIPPLGEVLGQYGLDRPLRLGFLAVGGVIMLGGVLLWRGAPRPSPQPLLTRVADFLATSFGSRDYFYLLLVAAAVNLALPDAGVMGLFLLVTTLLVHVFWIAIGLLTFVAPPRD